MNTLFKEIYIIQLSKQEHFWLCLFFHAKGLNGSVYGVERKLNNIVYDRPSARPEGEMKCTAR